ncbi:MAG: hypothetical protein WAJ93_23640 [Candidatus Nitrosopolaris sp.]
MGRCKMGCDGACFKKYINECVRTQFASHPTAVTASGLPMAATFGFVPGLMMGIRKG